MGVETYPVLEGREDIEDIPQEFWHVEWKILSDCFFQLEDVAKSLDVTPLSDFFNYCLDDALNDTEEDELEEMQNEAVFVDGWYEMPSGGRLWTPERVWFSADDGLKTTRSLILHLQQHPDSVAANNAESFVHILQEMEKTLVEAQQDGKRFYLFSG